MDTIEIAAKMVRDAVTTMSGKLSTFVKAALDDKQDVATMPTKVSDFTNDSGFQNAQQVEEAINAKVVSLYKPGGTATLATLPPLTAANSGYVYEMTAAFTSTADFREGAGHDYPAGTNVVVADIGNNAYKYDALTGILDGYVQKDGAKVLSDNNYTTAEKVAVATIGDKVDKAPGKGLSTEDYTTAEKNKLAGIAANATANAGTITGITMNGASKGTSGVVNLRTVSVAGDAWTRYAVSGKIPDFIVSANAADKIYGRGDRGGTRGVAEPVIFANRAGAGGGIFAGCFAIIGKTEAAVTLGTTTEWGETTHENMLIQTTPGGNTVYISRNRGTFNDANHVTKCVVNGVSYTLKKWANASYSTLNLSPDFLSIVDAVLFGDADPVAGMGTVSPDNAAPLMDGAASLGTSSQFARENHVHPTDTSRASAADMEAVKELLQSAVLYRTASGNPVIFHDGYAANLQKLAVTITPTQSGSGDPSPSNIRPISGVSSVTVRRTGKNLFVPSVGAYSVRGIDITVRNDGSLLLNGTATQDAQIAVSAGATRLFAGDYVVNGGKTNGYVVLVNYHYNGDRYAASAGGDVSFTVPAADNAVYVAIQFSQGATFNNEIAYPMIRPASVPDPTFAPYQGAAVTVPLVDSGNNNAPLSVYGGTLDATTGALTVTWGVYASYAGETLPGRWISDRDVYAAGTSPTTGAQVAYELAPADYQTYQLTAQQFAALAGYNCVVANAGTLEVEYRADVGLSIGALESNLTNAVLSLGAGF